MSGNGDWQQALGALLSSGSLPEGEQASETPAVNEPKKGRVIVSYERKGRGGKEVTILSGFDLDNDALCRLASELKQRLGAGGSARGGEILIQGDRRERVAALLREKGYRV